MTRVRDGLIFGLVTALWVSAAVADGVSYNRDIRPILADKCFACHGPDAKTREADLRLDDRESALRVLSLDDPATSELLSRIEETDPDLRMPPASTHKRVTKDELERLRKWIAAGANYEPHWSLIPPRDPPLPQVDSDWGTNGIDRFILARLKTEGLQPSPEADRRTLIRRVTLDLTGLPPTPAEVENFVNDPAKTSAAYEKVIDRLLQSPRYGEHIAYHWLDAARYGDSDGYESDPMRTMWPWRDWVVGAFNDNKPYDQFVIEQLAGDLLPNPTLRQLIATGFNRNHRQNNEGGILPEEWVVEYVADRTETTATVFMGLTWGCARCHDHKFDPISQKDYYRLFAYFNRMDELGNGFGASSARPMMSVPSLDRIEDFLPVRDAYEPLKAKLDAVEQSPGFSARYKQWLTELDQDEAAQAALPKALQVKQSEWTPALRNQAKQHFLTKVDPEGVAAQAELAPIQKQYDALVRTGARMMVMQDAPKPRQTFVLNRGAYDQPTEPVNAGTPDWLPPQDDSLPGNRLGLAQWLVSPNHPLTSRVAVNRFWQLHFGTGLVDTPDDFGAQGNLPSHPDLLDWLARRFIDSGWDVKGLHKLIVMSSTYRQSSVLSPELLSRDPWNRLLARGPRFRMPAALIRDQALAASGLMVEQIGGPPAKPYQPDGLWQEIIKGRPVYPQDKGSGLYRRSLYTLWRRAVKPPLMVLFDANERDTCSVTDKRTNTPLQALLLLNDVTFIETARGLAARMIPSSGDDAARLDHGMMLLLARKPNEAERAILLTELDAARERFQHDPESARALIALGESPPPKELPDVELASWTVVARILLNLDETINRQ